MHLMIFSSAICTLSLSFPCHSFLIIVMNICICVPADGVKCSHYGVAAQIGVCGQLTMHVTTACRIVGSSLGFSCCCHYLLVKGGQIHLKLHRVKKIY
jgi:hypothetical protein